MIAAAALVEALSRGLPGDRLVVDPDVLAAMSHDEAEWAPAGQAVAGARARMGLTQLARGAMPRFGGTQRLPRLVGGVGVPCQECFVKCRLCGTFTLRFGWRTPIRQK